MHKNNDPQIYTIRQEIAKRLRVYWRVYRKKVVSYNATLGIGRLPKERNRGYTGWSISGVRYIDGLQQ